MYALNWSTQAEEACIPLKHKHIEAHNTTCCHNLPNRNAEQKEEDVR